MLKKMLQGAHYAIAAGFLALMSMAAAPALAENGLGQPLPGQMGLQQDATPIAHEIHSFYDLT
jgi:cytochrome c oxidase subunit II